MWTITISINSKVGVRGRIPVIQIVQLLRDTGQVSDPVAVAVPKGIYKYLIKGTIGDRLPQALHAAGASDAVTRRSPVSN